MLAKRWGVLTLVLFAIISGQLFAGPQLPRHAKNVIILIADGCGFNQVDAASLYEYGKRGAQVYEAFPFKYAVQTFSSGGSYDPTRAWTDVDYIKSGATDSAAAATAMGCGVKSYNAAIGVDLQKKPLTNIAQLAEHLGKSTGVITTVPISHATPAGFVAHNAGRDNYAEIAKEMLGVSATDVIMGAGNPQFDNNGKLAKALKYNYVGGEDTWKALCAGTLGADADGDGKPDPWKLIQTRAEFQRLAIGKAPKRVAGVFQAYETTQEKRDGDRKADAYAVPRLKNVPTLAEMSAGALHVLQANPRGFFLMVEGGAVDWASHANEPGRVIEEEIDFNHAVQTVVSWVEKYSSWNETLVIVTADHETGYLTDAKSPTAAKALENDGRGTMPRMRWNSGGHSNSLVPFYAKGPGAELALTYATKTDPRRGAFIDDTNIFDIMRTAIAPPRK